MAFLGTIINFFGVLIFGILGALLKKGIPKRISEAIISAMAICVIYIGVDGALEAAPAVPAGSFLSPGLIKVLVMILCALGVATMWHAVFADVGVSVIAILNAMRTLSKK